MLTKNIRDIIDQLEQIKKMVDWAEINRSPDDFVQIRWEIHALLEDIRSHEPIMYKEKKMTELEKVVFSIADALALPDPHPAVIYAARYLIAEYDRRSLPDWIEALSNANDEIWEVAVDEVRRLKVAEEEANE